MLNANAATRRHEPTLSAVVRGKGKPYLAPARGPFRAAAGNSEQAETNHSDRSDTERSEGGRGSKMVKRDRPRRDLKPRGEDEPIRETFDQAWLKERRDARMDAYRRESHARSKRTRREEQTRRWRLEPSR